MTLSDTQLLILSAASQRNDHAAIPPANLKGSAAKKVIDRLLKQELLQELRAKDDLPVWRRGDDNRPYALRNTKARLGRPAPPRLQTGSGSRPASTAKRSNPGYIGQGDRVAETLGPRLLGG